MDVTATFVAHSEAAKLGQPQVRAFGDPAVAAKVLTAVNAATCNAGLDATLATLVAASTIIITFVGMQLDRTLPWTAAPTAAHRGDCIQRLSQHHAVVPVGAA